MIEFITLSKEEGDKLIPLFDSSPDTGRITFRSHYLVPPTIPHANDGIVLVALKNDQVVASVRLTFGKTLFEDRVRPHVFLSSLAVHPSCRGQGLGMQIVQIGIEMVNGNFSEKPLIFEGIQQGNTASMKIAQKLCLRSAGSFKSCLLKLNRFDSLQYTVTKVFDEQLNEFSQKLNEFYLGRGFQFYIPESADSLKKWADGSLRHLYLATDQSGKIVAGMGVEQTYLHNELHILNMKQWMVMLNKVVNMVPDDRILRPITISKSWFADGHDRAARDIWSTLCGTEKSANVGLFYRAKDKFYEKVFPVKWWIPQPEINMYVSELPLDYSIYKPYYPPA